jgi:hypothetical protein
LITKNSIVVSKDNIETIIETLGPIAEELIFVLFGSTYIISLCAK